MGLPIFIDAATGRHYIASERVTWYDQGYVNKPMSDVKITQKPKARFVKELKEMFMFLSHVTPIDTQAILGSYAHYDEREETKLEPLPSSP
jgi:hypothetical protein